MRKLVSTKVALAAALLVFVGLLGATWYMAQIVPRGFVPTMDQGYAIVVIQLPDGASLDAHRRGRQASLEDHPATRPA